MTRLPALHFDDLDPDGKDLWTRIVGSRGNIVLKADESLAGPFNAWVTVPEIGSRLTDLGTRLRFNTPIERRLHELAIVTVGARWHAEFEWWAHARWAKEHGISEDVLDALAAGKAPVFMLDDERVVHAIASQLATNGQVDQETYDAGIALLGAAGMVDLVTLCGYYTVVSFTLNAFAVELPPGVTPVWGDGAAES